MMRLGGVFILLLCMPLLATDPSKERAALDRSRNPDLLEAAAVSIAASGDAAAIADLARHLGQRSFRHRLDPGGGSVPEVERLSHVFRSLAEHPSQSSEALCIALSGNAHFNDVPVRLNFLLNALAAVRPMSEASAEVFRTTSRSGFLEVNGPLLAGNASPRALNVLAELFRDESLDVAQRVSIAHWGLLPNRTNADVVAMCVKLLSEGGLSHDVELAILESLYDYQAKLWFSTRAGQPTPPPWSSTSPVAKDALKSLAASQMSRPDLPPALRAAMANTLAQLR
jgi:hypothetical protein